MSSDNSGVTEAMNSGKVRISFRKLPISVTSFRNPLAPYCEDESCRRRASQEVELEGLTSLLCGRDAFLLQEELRELPEEG